MKYSFLLLMALFNMCGTAPITTNQANSEGGLQKTIADIMKKMPRSVSDIVTSLPVSEYNALSAILHNRTEWDEISTNESMMMSKIKEKAPKIFAKLEEIWTNLQKTIDDSEGDTAELFDGIKSDLLEIQLRNTPNKITGDQLKELVVKIIKRFDTASKEVKQDLKIKFSMISEIFEVPEISKLFREYFASSIELAPISAIVTKTEMEAETTTSALIS